MKSNRRYRDTLKLLIDIEMQDYVGLICCDDKHITILR